MYKCKYFKIEELVNPALLKTTSKNILWTMFDDRLLMIADYFREKYGPIFINGRGLTDCGLRSFDSDTGAKYSAHKLGRALDLHIMSIEDKNLSREDKISAYNKVRRDYLVEEEFIENEKIKTLHSCINFEDNISWLHMDTYNRENRLFDL